MRLGGLETRLLEFSLAGIDIQRPIYIAGLARSGSTVLLEWLAGVSGVATHRYRDFPFWQIPYWWNCYLERTPTPRIPVERPHGDGIMITRESPEGIEEPLWCGWFPDLHTLPYGHQRPSSRRAEQFEGFYRSHIRKLLLIRGGQRYLAKNNYLLPRADWVWQMFPDAELIVPVRHPLSHIASLVRQHQRFTEYARQDPRVAIYLAAAAHHEFGPQRMPICLDEASRQYALECWQAGDEAAGYAIQWSQLYGLVLQLQRGEHASQVHVVRNEDICQQPGIILGDVLELVGLNVAQREELPDVRPIAPRGSAVQLTVAECHRVWDIVREVASAFGYSPAG